MIFVGIPHLKTVFNCATALLVTLDEAPIGAAVAVLSVGGERQFRRRIMELGLLPGATVRVLRVAPLGDPIEVTTRGCNLSIRHAEARSITVSHHHRISMNESA
jgi:Fe2+ transport system protein FeoA